ncbi:MAG TPA: class I SAM-dependent methyltransferase [Anaerolineae bacterium]|nr:class I SAM-dependent methyltransferase [Anaerolineae bacterium]
MPTERIPYKACPLCGRKDWRDIHTTPMQRDAIVAELNLEPTITWRQCDGCGHNYTSGYWPPEILQKVCESNAGMPAEVCTDRFTWGRIVEMCIGHWRQQRKYRSCPPLLGRYDPRWLDVGCGLGTSIGAVAEYGFDVVGLEMRPAFVDLLRKCGYNVLLASFEDFTDPDGFDVILLAEFLEHSVFPVDALKHAKSLLCPGGTVYASCPSRGSFPWLLRDAVASGATVFTLDGQRTAGKEESVNVVQWGQVEHYHAFDREHLELAFRKGGLQPQEFHVGRRYFETIEVIGG